MLRGVPTRSPQKRIGGGEAAAGSTGRCASVFGRLSRAVGQELDPRRSQGSSEAARVSSLASPRLRLESLAYGRIALWRV
jgi:hypothetical protein